MSLSSDMFRSALKVLPGGVSRDTVLRSPHPFYAAKGQGCIVTDVEGREFIDFANNMASLIHGHAFAPVIAAVTAQLSLGTCFTFGTEAEIRLAEHLCSRSPAFQKVRFMNSGSEAVMAMIKAARAFTGRPKIAKVEGAYHGAYDYVEVSQAPAPSSWGARDAPLAVPLAVGTPRGVVDDVIVLPFNEADAAVHLLDAQADSIAGILIDPVPHRVGLIEASGNYVARLGEWAKANGALLMFDEVITFRTEVGGAQSRYDAVPDLTALGKAIGGGFPVGAVAGNAEVMDVFAAGKQGLRLPQSGTFSANPVTMVAGLAAMQHFDEKAVERLNRLGQQAREAIAAAIRHGPVPASVTGTGSMFRIHLNADAPCNYRESYLDSAGKRRLAEFTDRTLENGIILTNTGAGMLSTAMDETHVSRVADAVLASLRSLEKSY